ncbi:MAG: diguanylate cyclase [Microthrixaceae bacterium]
MVKFDAGSGIEQDTEPLQLGSDMSFLTAILANSSDLVLVVNEYGQLRYASAASERILGLWNDELTGRSLLEFVHPEDVGLAAQSLVGSVDCVRTCDVARTGVEHLTLRLRHTSDNWHEVEIVANNLIDNPAVGGILINARDITGRHRGVDSGNAAQRSFEQAFQRSPIGMAITTLDGNYTRVNQALCDLLGMSSESLLQTSVLETTHPDDLRSTVDSAIGLLDGKTVSFSLEKRFLAAGNRPVWTRATTTLLRDGDDNGIQFLTQVEDIEERRQLIEQLRISALRDPLTGLANRAGLEEYITSLPGELAIGVIALDLDRFKDVNDSAGHAVGDEVLKAVADRIRTTVRSGDQAARTGGDEFVVVFAEPPDGADFYALARRFIARIGEPILVGERVLTIGASAGVVVGSALNAPAMMIRADQASYEAKRGGFDVVVAPDSVVATSSVAPDSAVSGC